MLEAGVQVLDRLQLLDQLEVLMVHVRVDAEEPLHYRLRNVGKVGRELFAWKRGAYFCRMEHR